MLRLQSSEESINERLSFAHAEQAKTKGKSRRTTRGQNLFLVWAYNHIEELRAPASVNNFSTE
jgi:hypothetical protein